jgi:release factor glutamine methyltransferase
VIVSNPPYVEDGSPDLDPSVADWEPGVALVAGPDGLACLRELIVDAPQHLTVDGWLVLEIGADQGASVRELFEAGGYRGIEVRADLTGRDRIAAARRPAQ